MLPAEMVCGNNSDEILLVSPCRGTLRCSLWHRITERYHYWRIDFSWQRWFQGVELRKDIPAEVADVLAPEVLFDARSVAGLLVT